VFSEVDDGKTSYSSLKKYHDELERAFWILGRPSLLSRHQPILSQESLFKIFRVFCLLADHKSKKGSLTQVSLAKGEVEDITRCLVTELGREFDQQDYNHLEAMMPDFTLPVLITFLEGRYLQDVEGPAIEAAVEELYQMFVEQILEKGKLFQRLSFAPVWICREVELIPWEIRISRSSIGIVPPIKNKLISGPLVKLTKKTTVHRIPDQPGAKSCRFTLSSEDNKLVQLAAPDHRMKTRWLRALDEAITYSEESLPYQKILSGLRKEGRALEEEKEVEEKIRRASQADIIEQTQAELVAERLARVEAEEAAREEAAARALEEKRVRELTSMRQELEKLLEQETQAKRDEEIVRNLQARVLREEWEKREELEALQKEQNLLLEEERKKREAFEALQLEKETQLEEAQKRLRKLELERQKLDRELRGAREKIVMSERGKELLEARMKVKERTPPSRTYSLRPIRREQRATPLRSSSFNTHSNKRPNVAKNAPKENESSSLQQTEEQPDDKNSDTINPSNCYRASDNGVNLNKLESSTDSLNNNDKYCSQSTLVSSDSQVNFENGKRNETIVEDDSVASNQKSDSDTEVK
ncbi:Switch-associated protein 70, partial [Armadillidium nasatum]